MRIRGGQSRAVRKRGFTLIEMAAVLAIIAALVSAGISTGSQSLRVAKETQTRNKLDTIEQALTAFVLINGRLPCPARGDLPVSDAAFGLESCSGAVSGIISTGNARAGVIPIRNLMLPDGFMIDGWERRFSYAVDTRLTTRTGFLSTNIGPQGTGVIAGTGGVFSALEIRGTSTGSFISKHAVYVVLSHGPNGHGGWLDSRAAAASRMVSPLVTDADEIENADMNAAGAVIPYNAVYVSKLPTATFDDLIRYKNKTQLIRSAGKVFGDDICTMAKQSLYFNNGQGTDAVCANSLESLLCSQFMATMAYAINTMCVQ